MKGITAVIRRGWSQIFLGRGKASLTGTVLRGCNERVRNVSGCLIDDREERRA